MVDNDKHDLEYFLDNYLEIDFTSCKRYENKNIIPSQFIAFQ